MYFLPNPSLSRSQNSPSSWQRLSMCLWMGCFQTWHLPAQCIEHFCLLATRKRRKKHLLCDFFSSGQEYGRHPCWDAPSASWEFGCEPRVVYNVGGLYCRVYYSSLACSLHLTASEDSFQGQSGGTTCVKSGMREEHFYPFKNWWGQRFGWVQDADDRVKIRSLGIQTLWIILIIIQVFSLPCSHPGSLSSMANSSHLK